MYVDVERRTGVRIMRSCTLKDYVNDKVCYLFEELPSWNRCLWHVRLQLRELTAPGELSLVRIRDPGYGHGERTRNRDARLLFHALLTRHRCLVALDLNEAIIKGAEVGECRDLVVGAFQQNSALRKLSLGSFRNYGFIREEIFAAIAAKTHLQDLEVVGSGTFLGLTKPIGSLLRIANITTLLIPGIRFDEKRAENLVMALKFSDTVLELSVNVSILSSMFSSGTPMFCCYLANCWNLRALTVTDDFDQKTAAHEELQSIVDALVQSGIIQELKLVGFLLEDDCAHLFSRIVAQSGALKSLDIIRCQWIRVEPLCPSWTIPPADKLHRCNAESAFSERVRPWVEAFSENTALCFLAINLSGWTADDFGVFIQALSAVESLVTIFVRGVAPEDLPKFGRVIRDTGMYNRVLVHDQYLASQALLYALKDCPDVLRRVAVISARAPSAAICRETLLQLMTSLWSQVTTLRLFLSQEVLDNVTVQAVSKYLDSATALAELELGGCNEPDLSRHIEGGSLNPLLVSVLSSPSIRTLHVSRFHFGTANLRFLAGTVVTSKTLSEFSFSSCDSAENAELLRLLAQELAENVYMMRLTVHGPLLLEAPENRSIIQNILDRNMSLVTCAAYFVVNCVRLGRCLESLKHVRESSALVLKVQEMASVDEDGATAMIRSALALLKPLVRTVSRRVPV